MKATKITKKDPAKTEQISLPKRAPANLRDLGGSKSDHWNTRLLVQSMDSLWLGDVDEAGLSDHRKAVVAALEGIAPKDELEGMMAAQLIAAHNASMECYRRAMIPKQTVEGRSENLSQANKLSRTYATLVEALNRHRGKGQQKVTVEHVHVHAGGQAVVGLVTSPGQPGGGDNEKLMDQHHAQQIANAPQLALPCKDPEGDTVPVASDGKRPVPNARRKVSRRSKGK